MVYLVTEETTIVMTSFLSGISVVLSILAFILSGFTAYQVLTLRQTLDASSQSNNQIAPPAPNQPANNATAPQAAAPPMVSGGGSVQPGQFVQPAFRNKGQVELLKVNRISGERDVVNVQVRIRVLRPEKTVGSDAIDMGGTTARNPSTSETYEAVNGESTSSVSLFMMGQIDKQTSADAYAWLRIPEGVNTVDIYVPDTEAFQNVPIS